MSLIPPAARMRIFAVFAAGVAVVSGVFTGWGSPVDYSIPALAVSVFAAELAVVHLSFGKQRWTFSVTEAAIAAAYVYSPRAWTVLATAAGVFLAQVVRRQDPLRLSYTVMRFAAATGLGAQFAHSVGGGIWAAVGGMAVFWFANNALRVIAVATLSGRRLGPLVWSSAPFAALHSIGAVGLGILGAWLASNAPLGLFALGVPLVLLWISYDEQETRAAETALFAELARLQELASSRSVDGSAQVVLTAASRMFDSPEVEMLLLAQEGPVHYSGDAAGVSRRRVDPDALDEPWVLRALAECGTLTGIEDDAPWCVVVLGARESPLAAIRVRRAAGKPTFGRREVLLAGVLAEQAESWLSLADLKESRDGALAAVAAAEDITRELGELGAQTEPSLQVLRDSANRLARLASTSGAAPVGDIVDELYAVERAVASLLGAIALAGEPDLGQAMTDADIQMTGASRFDNWTTTGVLAP
ncbi:MAG TPA: hypothetical protein VHV76_12650 [Mycobacteriales bacterium]|nr:hypothetical protein [Mycobacteriales bacterium]